MQILKALSFFLFLNFNLFGVDLHLNFYSEQSYLSKEEVYPNSARLQTNFDLNSYFDPLLKVGSEVFSMEDAFSPQVNPTGYVYGAPGGEIHVNKFNVVFVLF